VISVERHKALADLARSRLERLGFSNVIVIHADGMEGAAGYAPFDRIVVTAAADAIPPVLIVELASEGVLIAPIGRPHEVQTLIRYRKERDGGLKHEHLMPVRFVPLLPGVP
jgi:protein-L-isoaspartate(D-aspartate) O-methyltransferase